MSAMTKNALTTLTKSGSSVTRPQSSTSLCLIHSPPSGAPPGRNLRNVGGRTRDECDPVHEMHVAGVVGGERYDERHACSSRRDGHGLEEPCPVPRAVDRGRDVLRDERLSAVAVPTQAEPGQHRIAFGADV